MAFIHVCGLPGVLLSGTYQQRRPADEQDAHDSQQLDDRLRGETLPLFGGLRRAGLGFAAEDQTPDGHDVAGQGHEQREDAQDREGDGEKRAAPVLAPRVDEAPGVRPLHRVLPDPREGQQREEQPEAPDDRQGLLRHARLHVVRVPVRVRYGHGSFYGHGTGQEQGAQTERCHTDTKISTQFARWIHDIPVQPSLVG